MTAAVFGAPDASGTPFGVSLRSGTPVSAAPGRARVYWPAAPPRVVNDLRVRFAVSRGFGGRTGTYIPPVGSSGVGGSPTAITIEELAKTRTMDDDKNGRKYSRVYIVYGTKDPYQARDLGPQVGTRHETYTDLYVESRSYRVISHADYTSGGTPAVEITVEYASPEAPQPEGGDTDAGLSYDFGAETENIGSSLAAQPLHGFDVHNVGEWNINVQPDGTVEGVDILSPILTISERHSLTEGQFSPSYRRMLGQSIGKVNSATFREWEAGEVLFVGANVGKTNRRWIVNYSFQVRRNRTGDDAIPVELVRPGTGSRYVVNIDKLGWQYIWTQNGTVKDGENLARGSFTVRVATVYPTMDFAVFGIGTDPLP